MGNYQTRLDRIEAAIAPKDAVHIVPVLDGQTHDHALAAHAVARALKPSEVSSPVVYTTERDLRL